MKVSQLKKDWIITEKTNDILVYPTLKGICVIDFDLSLNYDGNNLLKNYSLTINEIQILDSTLEEVVTYKFGIKKDNILLITSNIIARRIKNLFNQNLFRNRKILAISPDASWFSDENNALASTIGSLKPKHPDSQCFEAMLEEEYPIKVSEQMKPKIKVYIEARGLHYKALTILANVLPLYVNKIRSRGVNDAILSRMSRGLY